MTKAVVALAVSLSTVAGAADIVGVRGRKLTALSGGRLVVVARDSGVVALPDPGTTGATLTVTHGGADGTFPLPAGAEWSTTPGTSNRYRNPAAPGGPSLCASVAVRSGRLLKAACRSLDGLALPTVGDIEVTLSDGSGVDEVMCFRADVNDGTRLVADNPTYAAGRCPQCPHALTIGSTGDGPGEMRVPFDVAVDAGGNLYVAAVGRYEKFDSSGTFVTEWPGGAEQLTGLAVDASGDLYATEYHRVAKYDGNGMLLDSWGSFGGADGEFQSPEGIGIDGNGNVYVVDTQNNRIQKFDAAGTFLAKWGTFGSGNGQFMFPHGIAIDSSGNVYVADSGNDRIQKFDTAGTFLAAWGSLGTATGQFDGPRSLDVDAAGNVYVADTFNSRVQKFDSSGAFQKAWGRFGSRESQFFWPFSLTVDAGGNVFVADSRNDRVQKFACP